VRIYDDNLSDHSDRSVVCKYTSLLCFNLSVLCVFRSFVCVYDDNLRDHSDRSVVCKYTFLLYIITPLLCVYRYFLCIYVTAC